MDKFTLACNIIVLALLLFRRVFCNSCPAPAIWELVAKHSCPDESAYHCLLDSTNKTYIQKCVTPGQYPAGSRIIFDTLLNAAKCPSNRYQPRSYWSNEINDCLYEKSLCNEEGQVVFSNGTSTTDRQCRCNYREGYDFVFIPKNKCFCIPSEEECGCYIKMCPNSSYVLTPDYDCEIVTTPSSYTCPPLQGDEGLKTKETKTKVKHVHQYGNTKYNQQLMGASQRWIPTIPIILLLIALVVTGVTLVVTDIMQYGKSQESSLFIPTTGFTQAKSAINTNGIVVIKGRCGTGKSTIVQELVRIYADNNYIMHKLNKSSFKLFKKFMVAREKQMFILDNLIDNSFRVTPEMEEWKQRLEFLLQNSHNTKIILTTYLINRELYDFLIQHFNTLSDVLVDLDDDKSLNVRDKELLLRAYLGKHNIQTNESDAIVECNPVMGFPLMCVLFCCKESNISMGKRFFVQPHPTLVEKIDKIKQLGSDSKLDAVRYCVLVYIALNKQLNINKTGSDEDFETFRNLLQNIYERECLNDFSLVQNAANEFNGQYLDMDGSGNFRYSHQGIKQAVQITYGKINAKCMIHIIENISLDDLVTIIRPGQFKIQETECVCQISPKDDSDTYSALAERLVSECFKGEKVAKKVGTYLKEYAVNCSDSVILESVLNRLRKESSERKYRNCTPVLLAVFQVITEKSEICLSVNLEPIDFSVTWGIVCAAKNCRHDVILQIEEHSSDGKRGTEILNSIVDEYNNTLLHYLVVWDHGAGHLLLNNIRKATTLRTLMVNDSKCTPLHFAAYLARPVYFQLLLDIYHPDKTKTKENMIDKLINIFRKSSDDYKAVHQLLKTGQQYAGQCIQLKDQKNLTLDHHIVSELTHGSERHYKTIATYFS